NAGGLSGAVISRVLVSGLNTIGAAILLVAIAATGLLLATNFSFARFYESISNLFSKRFAALREIPARFRAWRMARRERRQASLSLGESLAGDDADPGPRVVNAEGKPGATVSGKDEL